MCEHGYARAYEEYESRLFDGVPESEEELIAKIEEKEEYKAIQADYYNDQRWLEERLENEEKNC